jgi:hypothetical protein
MAFAASTIAISTSEAESEGTEEMGIPSDGSFTFTLE